ncbi:iron-containing alcohol dehydrogenase, partial [Candidatus Symbiopectobacterium sp. NZEC135]|nr:iron-containing alcohol dehydrogenase [Candidatus Symbiopectobacterium sp. NZEC135]
LPSLLQAKKAQKRAKLLQYAERVWDLREGSEEQRIDGAIAATRAFFEKMGVPTHMADYQLDGSTIPTLVSKLKEHGMTALGEHADITPEVSQKIYERHVKRRPSLLCLRREPLAPFVIAVYQASTAKSAALNPRKDAV